MEDNYTIAKFVRREEIEASGTWIFEEMFHTLEYKFGNINKDDCYWLINKKSYYLIKDYILWEKGKMKIYGIDISLMDDCDWPNKSLTIYQIGLVYKKPCRSRISIINYSYFWPEVKKVIFNDPATIVYWKDGTKTVVKCQKGDDFDPEKGFAMAFLKKCWGNKGNFNDNLRKIMKEAK